jgi:hypothetical protein
MLASQDLDYLTSATALFCFSYFLSRVLLVQFAQGWSWTEILKHLNTGISPNLSQNDYHHKNKQ